MNAIDALMPTHSLYAIAAAGAGSGSPLRASAPPRESASTSATPATTICPINKYVIAADPEGREHVLLFSGHLQHSQMVPAALRPVSAGFWLLTGPQVRVVESIGSVSLNLNPRPQDADIIKTFPSRPYGI